MGRASTRVVVSTFVTGIGVALLSTGALTVPAHGQTLESALINAYHNNPTLNSQRAAVRATDEGVPQALSGYRPRINGTADYGYSSMSTESRTRVANTGGSTFARSRDNLNPGGYGVTASQTLYNGGQTGHRVSAAEAQVLASRETLRNTEQNVLLDGVTAYMNVLRDTAIVSLRRQNLQALEEQLRATRDRFQVGEVTRTDVAQSEARRADAQTALAVAEGNAATSRAVFRKVIGIEAKGLKPGKPIDRMLPGSMDAAVSAGLSQHPSVEAAKHGVDAASLQVKVAEASLLPTLTLEGSYSRRFDSQYSIPEQLVAQAVARLTVPIYQGGSEYSSIRQAKETLGQKRFDVDVARDQVRAAAVQSWYLLVSSKASIESSSSAVRANEIALAGVREEARVGQRTTLDVLNAQTELVNARVAQVTAQRDRVVASYSLLAAIGKLTARDLGLKIAGYDPSVHYQQVRDSWFGLRTPDGR